MVKKDEKSKHSGSSTTKPGRKKETPGQVFKAVSRKRSLKARSIGRDSREYVLWVQQSLNQILEMDLDEDGLMGPFTSDVIFSFQLSQGLEPDGIVGPNTEAALIQAGASPPPFTAPDPDEAGAHLPGNTFVPFPANKVTSPFGLREHPVAGGASMHQGVDYGIPEGTKVPAVFAGTVARSYRSDSFGETVIIAHGKDEDGNLYYTLSAHNNERLVQNGDKVTKNEIISLSGSTGISTGPHLHFELKIIPEVGPTPSDQEFFSGRFSVDPLTHTWPESSFPTAKPPEPAAVSIPQEPEAHVPAKTFVPFPANKVTSKFGRRIDPFTGKVTGHHGVDYGIPTGTKVPAVSGGSVARSYSSSSYGETVILFHGKDKKDNLYYTLSAHNSRRLVQDGDQVSQSEPIAYSGSTGLSTGPHLHFEVKVIQDGGPEPTEADFFSGGNSVDPITHVWPDLSLS